MPIAAAGEDLLGSLFADGTLTRPSAPAAETLWKDRFAQRTQRITASMIRELLKLTEHPDIISFAGGLPAPDVFPVEEVRAAADRILRDQPSTALQYTTTEGYRPLRDLLVRHMGRYGVEVKPENVLVTSGSQQALDLIGKLLINPGDRVLVEAPTYLGALQAFNAYQADYLPVPIDDDGMNIGALDDQMRAGPKFIYALPNFQNPAGVTLSLARRNRLVEHAASLGIPIVEDDPYGQLRFDGEHLPSLVKLDAETHRCSRGERTFTGNVLYLSTLSKTLAPGLRVAWVVAPEVVISKLVQIKQGADLHSSTFCQYVAYEVAKGGFLDRHVRRIRTVYGERRDAMLRALDRHAPPGVRWTKPGGGLFLWATLPEGFDTLKLLDEAIAEKVAFVPGSAFYPCGGGERTMRLNFSYAAPDVIEEGIRRLCKVIERKVKS
jgi:2-aminoadipate transaminase